MLTVTQLSGFGGGGPVNAHAVSINLNGTDEYLADTTEQGIGIVDDFTILAWFRPTNLVLQDTAIIDFVPNLTSNSEATLYMTGTDMGILLADSAGNIVKNWFDDTNPLSDDTWYHGGFTWAGSAGDALIGYKNGAAIADVDWDKTGGDTTGTMNDANRETYIGFDKSADRFEGHIHSVAVWSTVLAANEIASLYNGGNGAAPVLTQNWGDYTSTASLVHWWRLGLDSADIGADSGSGTIDVMDNHSNISAADIDAVFPA